MHLGPDGSSSHEVTLNGAVPSSVRLYAWGEVIEGIGVSDGEAPELIYLRNIEGDLVGEPTGILLDATETALAGGPDGACIRSRRGRPTLLAHGVVGFARHTGSTPRRALVYKPCSMRSLRRRFCWAAVLGLGVALACQPPAQTPPAAPDSAPAASSAPEPAADAAPWWDVPYPQPFDASKLSKRLPAVQVKGNAFVDESGATIVFQGVSIADPDKLVREGQWKRELFEAIRGWGANVVRLPIHPAAFRGIGRDAYFELLDQATLWATDLDLYLIVDWHSIGNLADELFQHPMYDTSRRETYEFWRSVAFRYKGVTTLALYELFNEPTLYNGTLGAASWEEWRAINEELIDIIRAHQNTAVPLVAGFDWAYDLTPVARAPIRRPGVAYVSHPYPQKTQRPFQKKWDKTFGFVAARYPLITTEIGYMPPGGPGAHVPVQDDGSYGPLITDYLAKKGASWVAWCFHPDWSPQLISDWSYTPTAAGEHFKRVMQARADAKTGAPAAQPPATAPAQKPAAPASPPPPAKPAPASPAAPSNTTAEPATAAPRG